MSFYLRFMVASRDIKPLELILKEDPAVVGPYNNTQQGCLQCFRKVTGSYTCTACGFPMCNVKCERGKLHREECQFFQEQNFGLNTGSSLETSSVPLAKFNDVFSGKESLGSRKLFASKRIPSEAAALAAASLTKAKIDQIFNADLDKEDNTRYINNQQCYNKPYLKM